jgi:hypothetical protein
MEKKLKLIWDFRGPSAAETARHFEYHLKESPLFRTELKTGVEDLSEIHSFAFIIVEASEMPQFRDRLKPHRGTLCE